MTVVAGAPEVSFLIFIVGFLIGWRVIHYHYKKRLADTEERLKLRDDKIGSLESKIASLENSMKEIVEQKQSPTSPPLKPNQIIYPNSSKNGVLWEWIPEMGMCGPSCPTHRVRLFYWHVYKQDREA
jgi:hypothetical protein